MSKLSNTELIQQSDLNVGYQVDKKVLERVFTLHFKKKTIVGTDLLLQQINMLLRTVLI